MDFAFIAGKVFPGILTVAAVAAAVAAGRV